MPGFFRVPVCAILFAACLLAGKADALPADPLAGTNIDGVFCGIGHKGAKTDAKPAQTGEAENSIPVGSILGQSAVAGRMKCHLTGHQAYGRANCPQNHAGICCPTDSGDSVITGKIIDIFTQPPYGSAGFLDTAIIPVSQQTLYRSHQSGPDPRPPAA